MLNLLQSSSYDKKLPLEFSTSFTETTPRSNHDFQNKVALSAVIKALFQRTSLPFGKMFVVFFEILKILKKFSIKKRQTSFQEFYIIIPFKEK